jgi:ATP-binding cassette subfamily F protein uup
LQRVYTAQMILLSVQNLSASRGAKDLFQNVSFAMESGEKIALIGVNGCGKSTLLSEIATAITTPNAKINFTPGLSVALLSQSPVFAPDDTILEHLFRGDSDVVTTLREYHHCLDEMEGPHAQAAGMALSDLMVRMDLAQAWDYEHRVTSILKELHIEHLNQKMGTLSGGMIKKIELACLFFEDVDLLIMDEPTNHLDIETIDWMEAMLKRSQASVLMVTHDRYFLDRVCNRILEIDQQKLFQYDGNYPVFLEQRAERLAAQQNLEATIQSVLRVELEWLKRGPKARSTKQKARKERIEVMQNRTGMQEESSIELGVAGRRMGKKILELKAITKSFGDHSVLTPFSYTFKEGDKIGILGPNGAGKSTLFNLISERILPDTGIVDTGVNTQFGHFEQQSDGMDPSMSVLAYAKQYGEQITMHDGIRVSASKLLERFLFPTSSFNTLIAKLSGGERRRLQLVCMLLENPNFLLFDEPTNDLDVMTLSVLESFLLGFKGCILIISHDRYFLDRVVDQLFVFDGKGGIAPFWGGYSDYADSLKVKPIPVPVPVHEKAPIVVLTPESNKKKNLSFKEQAEFQKLETDIEALEAEKEGLTKLFLSDTTTADAYKAAGLRLSEIEESLESKMARWEYLAERA